MDLFMGIFFLSHQESSKYLIRVILLETSKYRQNERPESWGFFWTLFPFILRFEQTQCLQIWWGLWWETTVVIFTLVRGLHFAQLYNSLVAAVWTDNAKNTHRCKYHV